MDIKDKQVDSKVGSVLTPTLQPTQDNKENSKVLKEVKVTKKRERMSEKKVVLKVSPYNSGYVAINLKALEDLGQYISASISSVNTMLSYKEEMAKFMPSIIGTSANNANWDSSIRAYWDNINVRVIGQRFELNDKYISIIASLVEEHENILQLQPKGKKKLPKLILKDEKEEPKQEEQFGEDVEVN